MAFTGPDINTYTIPEVQLGDTFNFWREITNTNAYKLNKLRIYDAADSASIGVTYGTDGVLTNSLPPTVTTGHTFASLVRFTSGLSANAVYASSGSTFDAGVAVTGGLTVAALYTSSGSTFAAGMAVAGGLTASAVYASSGSTFGGGVWVEGGLTANAVYASRGSTFAADLRVGSDTVGATLGVCGGIMLHSASPLRFGVTTSNRWVAFQAPSTVAANLTWTLPSVDGTVGQVLCTTSRVLGWTTLVLAGSTGNSTELQYKNNEGFSASSALTLTAGGLSANAVYASNGSTFGGGVWITGGVTASALYASRGSTFAANLTVGLGSVGATLGVCGGIMLHSASPLRFGAATSGRWVAFRAPGSVAANFTWTLPSVDGGVGQVLCTNGGCSLGWASLGYKFSVTGQAGEILIKSTFGVTSSAVKYIDDAMVFPNNIFRSGGTENTSATLARGSICNCNNTFIGDDSGYGKTGCSNIALGNRSAWGGAGGSYTTAIGMEAGGYNSSGGKDTNTISIGHMPGFSISVPAIDSISMGYLAAYSVCCHLNNIAIGYQAMSYGASGSCNIAIGEQNSRGAQIMNSIHLGKGINYTNASVRCNNILVGESSATGTQKVNYSIGIGRYTFADTDPSSTCSVLCSIGIGYSTNCNTHGSANNTIGACSLFGATGSCNNILGAWGSYYRSGSNNNTLGYGVLQSNVVHTVRDNNFVGLLAANSSISCSSNGIGAYTMNSVNNTYDVNSFGHCVMVSSTTNGINAFGHCSSDQSGGCRNNAIGTCAFGCASNGCENNAVGHCSMNDVGGTSNCNHGIGQGSMRCISDLCCSIGIGVDSMVNQRGLNNIGVGSCAYSTVVSSGYISGNCNISVGSASNCTGTIGIKLFTAATAIGYDTCFYASNTITLGNTAASTAITGSIVNNSDCRNKTDVRPTIWGLDFINALRPVDYRWDHRSDYADGTPDGSKKGTRFHSGLLAQEVQAAASAAGEDFAGVIHWSYNGISQGPEEFGLKYDYFYAPLIRAVQELSVRTKQLEAQWR